MKTAKKTVKKADRKERMVRIVAIVLAALMLFSVFGSMLFREEAHDHGTIYLDENGNFVDEHGHIIDPASLGFVDENGNPIDPSTLFEVPDETTGEGEAVTDGADEQDDHEGHDHD